MADRSHGWTAVKLCLATMFALGVSSLSSAKADDLKAKDAAGSVGEGLELPILHFSVRMKSLAQPSDQAFENTLTHTKAHEASAERMAAVLAGEASLLDAEKFSGREKIDFFERAAREGDAAAAAALGDKLDLGDIVSENPGRAFGY